MKRLDTKGFGAFELLVVLVVLLLIGSTGYLLYKRHSTQTRSDSANQSSVINAPLPKPTGKQLGTYKVADSLYPRLPASYELIRTDPGTPDNGATSVEYITDESFSAVESTIRAICASYGFRFEEFTESSTSQNGGSYTSTGGQCHSNDDTWGFYISNAGNIQYQDWKSSLSAGVLQKDLSHMNWVSVGSYGPPVYNGSSNDK